MKTIYLFISAIIFSIPIYAQAPNWLWAQATGGAGSDGGNALTTDPSGNVYTTGIFVGTVDFDPGAGVFNLTSADSTVIDVFVSKTDSLGNFVWAKAMGGTDMDAGRSIAFDPSGSGAVYVTGYFKGTADFNPGPGVFNLVAATPSYSDNFICKLDTAGTLMWAKATGGAEDDAGYSIAMDPSGTGNVYCMGYFKVTADFDPNAGITNLTSAGNTDIFVSKYNSSGNLIWARAMGGTGYDWGLSMAKCPAGNTDVYTTGFFSGTGDFDPGNGNYFLTSAGSDDIFVSKLDSSGTFLWAKAMGGTDGDYASAIASDISGNVYTTGRFRTIADFDPGAGTVNLIATGSDDIFISKLDNSGNFVWAKGIGGAAFDVGSDIAVDATGNVYTTGGFTGTVDFDPGAGTFNVFAAGNIDIFICGLDSSGNFSWANQGGGTNGDNSRSLAIDAFGHFYVTGAFSSTTLAFTSIILQNASVGQSDIFLAKLDKPIPTGIETISSPFPIAIFPNPFTDEMTIRSTEPGEIKVTDVCGRIVYTQKQTTIDTQLPTARWQQGIYFVEVLTAEGRAVKKVVKQ